jgi:hypothetical protein
MTNVTGRIDRLLPDSRTSMYNRTQQGKTGVALLMWDSHIGLCAELVDGQQWHIEGGKDDVWTLTPVEAAARVKAAMDLKKQQSKTLDQQESNLRLAALLGW